MNVPLAEAEPVPLKKLSVRFFADEKIKLHIDLKVPDMGLEEAPEATDAPEATEAPEATDEALEILSEPDNVAGADAANDD